MNLVKTSSSKHEEMKAAILLYHHVFVFLYITQLSSVYSKNKIILPAVPVLSKGTEKMGV